VRSLSCSACGLVVAAVAVAFLGGRAALAGPFEDARRAHDKGNRVLEDGNNAQDVVKLREGLASLRAAKELYQAALADPALRAADRTTAAAALTDVESKIDWWSSLFPQAKDAGGGPKRPEVKVPEPGKGEPLGAWCGKVRALYEQTKDPLARAAIAERMATKAGTLALPALFALLASERDAKARDGVKDGLVLVGGPDVARAMESHAKASDPLRDEAIDVVCRCLEKPERAEAEKPWCRAVRTFHEERDKRFSLALLGRLDAMGYEGTAALGEILYVDDFGYHDYTATLLAKKRDRRAVPPLVFKLNRFAFEYREQMPAHKALLDIGWFAVPELIDRLDDSAAGVWISWTLRKICSETMGTDKKKWTEWWKLESKRHPELSDDPSERPPGVAGPDAPAGGTTTPK